MESIKLQELMGMVLGKLKEIERHTRCTSCNTEGGGSGGSGENVTVTNPVSNPVNVSIVPSTNPPTPATTSAGVNIPVPAGFKTVSIALLTGNINVTMSDGSTYPMDVVGESLVQVANGDSILPAYTITGTGTYKWSGIK